MINFTNHSEGIIDNGQVGKAEKIHFEKTEFFNLAHGKLSGNGAFGRNFEGQKFNEVVRSNDDTASVDTVVSDGAFETGGKINDLFRCGVGFVFLFKVGDFFDGIFQMNMTAHNRIWYHFG